MRDFYTFSEVMKLSGLSRSTLERDVRAGHLQVDQRVPRGPRVVSRADLLDWWARRGNPVVILNLEEKP